MTRAMFLGFAIALVETACSSEPSVSPQPRHDACETAAECPPDEPICGAIVLSNGATRRLCTTHCTAPSECFSRSGLVGVIEQCVTVDTSGEIVEAFDDAICIRDCDEQHPCPNGQDCIESDFFGAHLCAPQP